MYSRTCLFPDSHCCIPKLEQYVTSFLSLKNYTPKNGRFSMLLQLMKMSKKHFKYQKQQLSVARDAITVWQRRIMLPMSLWMAAISILFHSSTRTFSSSTRVVACTGRRKISTCRTLQTCSIGLRSVHTDDGLQLEVLLNHLGTGEVERCRP